LGPRPQSARLGLGPGRRVYGNSSSARVAQAGLVLTPGPHIFVTLLPPASCSTRIPPGFRNRKIRSQTASPAGEPFEIPHRDKKCADYAVSRRGPPRFSRYARRCCLRKNLVLRSPLSPLQLPYCFPTQLLAVRESHRCQEFVQYGSVTQLLDNAWEGSMHPQTIHLDSIWLVPPALAVSFMVWVLWSWWKEAHRMNRRNRH
jgi:hypothetical protein